MKCRQEMQQEMQVGNAARKCSRKCRQDMQQKMQIGNACRKCRQEMQQEIQICKQTLSTERFGIKAGARTIDTNSHTHTRENRHEQTRIDTTSQKQTRIDTNRHVQVRIGRKQTRQFIANTKRNSVGFYEFLRKCRIPLHSIESHQTSLQFIYMY